jgi:7-cyano-7-deazaguanine synthase
MEKTPLTKAVVVFSGGQDSTTCLAWAQKRFDEVHALLFDYGQRHRVELDQAAYILNHLDGKIPYTLIRLHGLSQCATSALTRPEIAIDATGGLGGLPSTFTPGRNLVFLTMAASFAISRGIFNLVAGVCQADYSGYPDCRCNTIEALQEAIRLGNDVPIFRIYTPLMFLTKRQTIQLADSLGILPLLEHTHTCYLGKRPACGQCPACKLRLKGFAEAGLADPLAYEAAAL